MKIKILLILLIGIILSARSFVSEHSDSSLYADTTYKNPNGSSELALLMRHMQEYTNDAKEALANDKSPAAFPGGFNNIYTAKISDGMSKSDFYNQFADLYLTAVKNYSVSDKANRAETYNNMVSACLACHSQHCPGPVPVIRKMVWDPGK